MPVNRALIADDHVIVRAGLKTLIKEMYPFFQLDEAVNGDQVIGFIKKNDYDILILDVNMPDTDAITLITNIFACKEKSRINRLFFVLFHLFQAATFIGPFSSSCSTYSQLIRLSTQASRYFCRALR